MARRRERAPWPGDPPWLNRGDENARRRTHEFAASLKRQRSKCVELCEQAGMTGAEARRAVRGLEQLAQGAARFFWAPSSERDTMRKEQQAWLDGALEHLGAILMRLAPHPTDCEPEQDWKTIPAEGREVLLEFWDRWDELRFAVQRLRRDERGGRPSLPAFVGRELMLAADESAGRYQQPELLRLQRRTRCRIVSQLVSGGPSLVRSLYKFSEPANVKRRITVLKREGRRRHAAMRLELESNGVERSARNESTLSDSLYSKP